MINNKIIYLSYIYVFFFIFCIFLYFDILYIICINIFNLIIIIYLFSYLYLNDKRYNNNNTENVLRKSLFLYYITNCYKKLIFSQFMYRIILEISNELNKPIFLQNSKIIYISKMNSIL